jgi:hypothetical protein
MKYTKIEITDDVIEQIAEDTNDQTNYLNPHLDDYPE